MTKLFLDTNILARFLLGDVFEQHSEVLKIFEKAKAKEIALSTLPEVFIELFYVLKTQYDLYKLEIVSQFEKVANFSFLEFENKPIFLEALQTFKNNNISLEDAYFINFCLIKGLEFYSFDQKALKTYQNLKNQ